MMLAVGSLVYVRDYVQSLQNQQNPSVCGHTSGEKDAHGIWEHSNLPKLKEREKIRESVVIEASDANLSRALTYESSLTFKLETGKSTLLSLAENDLDQKKTCLSKSHGRVENFARFGQPYSLINSAHTGRPQVNTTLSQEFCFPNHHRESEFEVNSPSTLPQRKVEHGWESQDFRGRVIGSTAIEAFTKEQSLRQRHVTPLSPTLRNSERSSGPTTQVGSRLRRLSPLRESSGNIHRSSDIDQQSVIVQKTRSTAKSVLHSPKPSDSFCQSPIRKSNLKSFLSLKPSFADDYINGALFLGRYRTPSTPELRFSQPSNPPYQSQPLLRSVSLTSLKHLLPDKERSLHIGVNNPNLFLPSKSNHSFTPLNVTYRPPQRDEHNTPTMTPFAVIGPSDPASAASICAQAASAPNFASITRRSTSTVAIAGSMDSSGSAENCMIDGVQDMAPFTAPDSLDPAQLNMASVSNESSQEIGETNEPISMLEMMGSFQATACVSTGDIEDSHPKHIGVFYELFPDMTPIRIVSVDSETSFFDDLVEENELGHDMSRTCIRLVKCKHYPCSFLTHRDEAYACGHPEVVDHCQKEELVEHIGKSNQHSVSGQGLESSILATRIQNRDQRSVSFAEAPAERTSTRTQFAVYRRSTSLSNPIFPSPLISPRLRGPSFSREFEENMLTLPMPPVDHSVPFAGRRSSTVSVTPSGGRSIITLSSKKPKGFWAKLGDSLKGCFGTR